MFFRAAQQRLISLFRSGLHDECTDPLPQVDQLGDTGQRTTGVVRSAAFERVGTPMVYKLRRHRPTVSFTHPDQSDPKALFALGSTVRSFKLQEFVNFWLSMVKVRRKAVDAHLALTGSSALSRKNRTPAMFGLKRRTQKITFTHLERKKMEVFVTLGHEVRMFRFEDFIDFWLDVVELAPKVVQAHSTYLDELAKRRRERSRGGQHICILQ